jgi:hypothetical protein
MISEGSLWPNNLKSTRAKGYLNSSPPTPAVVCAQALRALHNREQCIQTILVAMQAYGNAIKYTNAPYHMHIVIGRSTAAACPTTTKSRAQAWLFHRLEVCEESTHVSC